METIDSSAEEVLPLLQLPLGLILLSLRLLFLLTILSSGLLVIIPSAIGADPLLVRVGYYDNPPKLMNGGQGQPCGYLKKPFTYIQLGMLVRRALHQS